MSELNTNVDELNGKVIDFDINSDNSLDFIDPNIEYFAGLIDKLIEIRSRNDI